MNDIDNRLRGTIQDLAEEVRMRPDLASIAMAVGRRRLRRRRAGTTLVAVMAAVSVAAGLTSVLDRHTGRGATPRGTTAEPGAADPGGLPVAKGVPGAAERPDLVGSDPGLLHFDVDLSAITHQAATSWMADSQSERVNIVREVPAKGTVNWVSVHVTAPGRASSFDPAQQPLESKQLNVAGRPATLARYAGTVVSAEPGRQPQREAFGWRLSWEPVDGLPVVLSGGPDGEALQMVAAALRFDRARRCVQPLRTTGLPPGGKVLSCTVGLDATGGFRSASFYADFPEPFRHMAVSSGAGYTSSARPTGSWTAGRPRGPRTSVR